MEILGFVKVIAFHGKQTWNSAFFVLMGVDLSASLAGDYKLFWLCRAETSKTLNSKQKFVQLTGEKWLFASVNLEEVKTAYKIGFDGFT